MQKKEYKSPILKEHGKLKEQTLGLDYGTGEGTNKARQ